ncbi:sulfotransferase family protein [Paracoccus sp. TK19116]|uniref:Sulfotransferase family protein n=1 Tax=Paracoccus albicereus TaxID=2922394 RepID=A0ABT1MN53_9RHOB|nr:sulfotransferase family protein [Paracoccus albicereus]MCQ0969695.1 sulfotransferase family protein [Paracoccus albicereus]
MIRGTPHPFMIAQCVCYAGARDTAYLSNAKAGCSTVRAAMIKGLRRDAGLDHEARPGSKEIHGRQPIWSTDLHSIGPASKVFTVVRNPYTRILSAYLDKIARRNALRFQFLISHRMPLDAQPSFVEFLRLLGEKPDLEVVDQHHRPQVENVHLGRIAPVRVQYLENFSDTAGDLCAWLDWDLPIEVRATHGTDASGRLAQFYDDEALEIVARLYADDFEAFGYSLALEDAGTAPSVHLDIDRVDPHARWQFDMALLKRRTSDADVARDDVQAKGPVDRMLLAEAGRLNERGLADLDAELPIAWPSLSGSGRMLALLYQARRAEEAEDLEAAIDALNKLLTMCPYLVGQRFRLAKHQIVLGRLEAARAQRFALQHGSWQTDLVRELMILLGEAEPVPAQGQAGAPT